MGYFYDGGIPPKDEKSTPIEGIEVGMEERLWDAISENTSLKQENFYLRTKIKQIEQIMEEINNYNG